MFQRIIDPLKIRETLDAYMLFPKQQRVPFIATIFSREYHKGGICYDGYGILGACQDDSARRYTITSSSSSNYQLAVYHLNLDQIEYIDVLR